MKTVVALAAALSLTGACRSSLPGNEITVAAATSLREALPELVRVYEAAHPGRHVGATYAASGDLQKQVEAGAPVDVVLFAGARPIDELVHAKRLVAESRRVVASNALVLVGPKGGPPLTFATLTALPSGEKLAVGDPRTVPAGEYAHDYLATLGEWSALESRLLFGANVAAVLVYARQGEAAAAVVYRTELRGVGDLVVLDEARGPGAPHPQVIGAAVTGGRPEAQAFLDFVASAEGSKVLASFGFGPP